MKKILILISVAFLMSGCYDNIELDNLNIVAGIGISFEDNQYIVTYEILNDTQTLENTTSKSFTVTGSGQTISEAFTDAQYKCPKIAYYAHLSIILIDENITGTTLRNIVDYLFRDVNIRDEFQMAITKGITPLEVLGSSSSEIPIISEFIKNAINNSEYNNSMGITDTFQKIIAKLISQKQDIILNSITLENNELTFSRSYIFQKYNIRNTVSKEDTTIYNMLTNNTFNAKFKKLYGEDYFVINITSSKANINVSTNTITIDITLTSQVLENKPSFDLKDPNIYNTLNSDFTNLIEENIINFIKTLQQNSSDILGLQNIYYKNNNALLHHLWEVANIKVNVDLKITTKGFIFEVEN